MPMVAMVFCTLRFCHAPGWESAARARRPVNGIRGDRFALHVVHFNKEFFPFET